MIRGLYTSALGMITQQKVMDAISNNIANVNTTAYKKEQVVTRTFTEELMRRLDDNSDLVHSKKVGNFAQGLFVDDVYMDFSNGNFKQTAGSLDCAISGDGFFAVSVVGADGNTTAKYTRDGSFTLGTDGTLLTKDGKKLMSTKDEAIVIPNGEIIIDEKGNVYSNNILVDTLKMVNFEDAHTLRQFGDNLYDTTAETIEQPFNGTILQGYLENSNVNSVKEMVAMITVARAYDANQRMISVHDSTLGRLVNDIARK